MVKKKREQTGNSAIMLQDEPTVHAKPSEALQRALEDISSRPDVAGYILRTDATATVKLKTQANLTDYALLSSEMQDFAEKNAEKLALGKATSLLVETENAKALLLLNDTGSISIFMAKTTDHTEILPALTT